MDKNSVGMKNDHNTEEKGSHIIIIIVVVVSERKEEETLTKYIMPRR